MASTSKQELCSIEEMLFKQPFDNQYPLFSTKLICPLETGSCNGIIPTSFSEARFMDLQYKKGVFLCAFFREQWLWLYRVLANDITDETGIVTSLKDFFMNKKHHKCLRSLQNMKKKSHVQAILAAHLFEPLASRGSYLIDKKHFDKDLRTCPGCNEKINLGDTSFGNFEVWYGYADIIVDKSAVEVDLTDNSSQQKNNSGDEYTDYDGSDEPVKKRQRLSSSDKVNESDDDNFSSDEDFDVRQCSPDIVEVKCALVNNQPFYQSLAQTITNAFLQVKKSPDLKDTFIPSFMATEKCIRIEMYCFSKDLLLVSEDLTLIDPDSGELNVSTIIYLWLSLNTDVLAQSLGLIENDQSKFREFVNKHDKYSCYLDGISHPLNFYDKKETQKPVFEAAPLFNWSDFDRYVAKAEKIYSHANSTIFVKK